ncbi:hypothetical protein BSKO_09002 [Bryopsis sp. KO-2023]|nr:hypothetical protein BSKO_09002 [Bryopsis sp. KO-2023]
MRLPTSCVVVLALLCVTEDGFSIGGGFGLGGEVDDISAEVSPEFTFTLDPVQSPEEPEDDPEPEKEKPCERFYDPHTGKIFCFKDGIYSPTGEIYEGSPPKHVVHHYGKGK